jgi:hypothetical protein
MTDRLGPAARHAFRRSAGEGCLLGLREIYFAAKWLALSGVSP